MLEHLSNPTILAFLIMLLPTLIQISPLKINPWDCFFKWLGKKINGDRFNALENKLDNLWIGLHRQAILIFARECRRKVKHSSDEWDVILNTIEEYELYCQENKIPNGVVKIESEYLRNLYLEISKEEFYDTPDKKKIIK